MLAAARCPTPVGVTGGLILVEEIITAEEAGSLPEMGAEVGGVAFTDGHGIGTHTVCRSWTGTKKGGIGEKKHCAVAEIASGQKHESVSFPTW